MLVCVGCVWGGIGVYAAVCMCVLTVYTHDVYMCWRAVSLVCGYWYMCMHVWVFVSVYIGYVCICVYRLCMHVCAYGVCVCVGFVCTCVCRMCMCT